MHVDNDNYRISAFTGGMMVGVAMLTDMVQMALAGLHLFIPLFGSMLSILSIFGITTLGGLIFFLWFHILGVSQIDSALDNPASTFAFSIAELAPFVNFLPLMTLKVGWEVYSSRLSDRKEMEKSKKKRAQQRQRQLQQAMNARMLVQAANQNNNEYGE